MLLASRTLMRLGRTQPSLPVMMARAQYSSAAANDEYHSLDDQLFHELQNKVTFQGETSTVFDASSAERRFVPYEIKELSFKCGMGIMGVWVWDYMYHLDFYSEAAAAAFALNWAYKTTMMMTSAIRKVELHKDGKTVTMTPRIGSPFQVKISEVRKLRHEKELVETFEESYMFPVQISGKKWFMHG